MESDFKSISAKAVRGVFSLTFRRIILLGVNVVTLNIILAKILPVSTLGTFIIANSVLAFFTFFSDIGLAAALIRKKELNKEDLKTTFTIQEILAMILTFSVFLSAPVLSDIYKIGEEGIWLIRALAVGFFLTSLKVIPSVILERNLNFGKLVWVDVIETLAFNAGLIILTRLEFGLFAFTYSTLIRSFLGVLSIYLVAPWKIAIGFSKVAAKELLSYGVPFQLNSILALLKDRLVPLVIAGIVGSTGVGFISQGQRVAFLPLEVMSIATRVAFPAFSRLQNDKVKLKIALEQSLFLTALFLFPALFGIISIAPSFVKFLGARWEPVLPLVYLFSVTTFWAMLSTSATNFLNAIGKINTTLKLMIMWTLLEWGLAPLFTIKFGFVGMGVSSALISFTSLIPIFIVKKETGIKIIKNIWQPLVASVLMAFILIPLANNLSNELPTILIMISAGILFYIFFINLLAKKKFRETIKEAKNAFLNR